MRLQQHTENAYTLNRRDQHIYLYVTCIRYNANCHLYQYVLSMNYILQQIILTVTKYKTKTFLSKNNHYLVGNNNYNFDFFTYFKLI